MSISLNSLNALGWSLTSLAIILTFGRFWIRWKRVKQVGWDDILNGCALVALIVYMALFAVYFPISLAAELYKLGISQTPPTDSELVYALELQLANAMFFWISKYAVKASFLATYYYVFRISGNFRKAWWFVVIYTALTFLAIFFGALWGCGSPSNYANVEACSSTPLSLAIALQAYSAALNISGDLLVIALPISMLRKLSLRRSQKYGLAAIFGIVAVDIFFNCLRTAYSVDLGLASSTNLTAVWTLCEPTIAVIACALPSYRTLLSSPPKPRGPSYEEMRFRGARMGQSPQKMRSHYDIIELGSINNEPASESSIHSEV